MKRFKWWRKLFWKWYFVNCELGMRLNDRHCEGVNDHKSGEV